ncbi:MAG: hypothetical protein LUH47_03420 [Clostridiales bacterium]|nr:hypothetical protein [Clostridiales bacterium]
MDTVIVIMEKDKKSGFLEKEAGSLSLSKNEEYIVNVYSVDDSLYLRLSVDRDVKDWEYNAVFDYFDTEVFGDKVNEISEVGDTYNPTWEFKLSFDRENQEDITERVEEILEIFKTEINDVFNVIADKEGEYLNEEEQ